MSLGTMEQRTEGMKRQAQELIEQAYNRGYNAGYDEGKGQAWSEEVKKYEIEPEKAMKYIEQGRNEAWEAARKIFINEKNGGLKQEDFVSLFDGKKPVTVLAYKSATEVVEKLRAYEEKKQKEDEEDKEIHVGDEVILNGNSSFDENTKAIVIALYNNTDYRAMFPYNVMIADGDTDWVDRDDISGKTGRTFPEIVEVLKKMQEDKA